MPSSWIEAHPPSSLSILRTRLGFRVLLGVTVCAVVPIAVVRLLAPVAGLATAVGVVLLLALVAAVVVSVAQARRSLLSLAELHKGTRRIAAGDFDSPVRVLGEDELAQLSTAFNEMAAKLEERFHTQERTAAIDREILSSVDTASIAESVLDLVPDVYPCHAISLTILSPHDPTSATTWMDFGGPGDRTASRTMRSNCVRPFDAWRICSATIKPCMLTFLKATLPPSLERETLSPWDRSTLAKP